VIRAAICLGVMLVLLMFTVVCILTGDAGNLTGSGGTVMAILSVLAVLLSVGMTDRCVVRNDPDETDDPPMPKVDRSIKYLQEVHRHE
jgi:hypothetical protein